MQIFGNRWYELQVVIIDTEGELEPRTITRVGRVAIGPEADRDVVEQWMLVQMAYELGTNEEEWLRRPTLRISSWGLRDITDEPDLAQILEAHGNEP